MSAGVEQLPIADHGLIGDLRSCALVGNDGTIDWFCAGRFDRPSVFASVLDAEKGGSWSIGTQTGARHQQYYFPDSNILVTRLLTDDGIVEVQDFMPILQSHDPDHRQRLVRRVVAQRGHAQLHVRVAARPDYGRVVPRPEQVEAGVRLADGDVVLGLSATVDLDVDDGDVTAAFDLSEGEVALFVLEVLEPDEPMRGCTAGDVDRLFEGTATFWHDWLAHSSYTGRWRERVNRSALTLKLMCHEPTGGIVAAPTTSLPEQIGGERNWDYRYVWIRDAAFSLYALLRLGFTDEAAAFMHWLADRLATDSDETGDELGPLRVLYTLDGEVPTAEHELDHLAGYRGSLPVRVGNAAVEQLQLDVYGELIDSIYLFNKYGPGISHAAWTDVNRIVDWLAENWERPDAGMWEIRGEPQRHTTSLLMAWVAVERTMRVARQRGLPGDLEQWGSTRDAIYRRIMEHCWDDDLGAFVQHENTAALDAGVLLMPMVKFVSPDDPRFVSTLGAIEERLVADSLVFRYDHQDGDDGIGGPEGTFSLCSFWYVEALTRVGRLDDARLALEKMFTYANHLGLYAEQIGLNGEQLGNFPQAFTHLSLISAAINLDRALQ